MEVDIQETSTEPLSKMFVRDGVNGNYEIVFEMIRIIRHSVDYDLGLKELTANLLLTNRLTSNSNPAEQLTAIYNFISSKVSYIEDQAGLIESLKSARVTLADGYGDCDDIANTIASMVGSIGFEDTRIAMARYSASDTSFVHVYPVVYLDDGSRIPMDATLPNGKIGQEVQAFEIKEIPVFKDVKGLDGFSGLFGNIKYQGKKLGKAIIEVAPLASDYLLPFGFVSGRAFATGARLIGHVTSNDNELSINAVGSRINEELDKVIVALIRSQIALDMAQSHAAQIAAQLSTVKNGRENLETYQVIKDSISERLRFINNFEAFAKENHITVVRLNPTAMLAAGITGAGVGVYFLYQIWKSKRKVY